MAGRSLGRHVQPRLDEARLDRQWRGVQELASERWPVPVAALAIAVAVLVAVAALAVLHLGDSLPVAAQGTVVETAAANPQLLRLADGSRLQVARRSRVQVAVATPEQVRVVLMRGALTAEVEPRESREFVVAAGGYEVVVRGTKFQVALVEGASTVFTVLVERGRVEVRRSGSAAPGRFLDAGEGLTETVAAGNDAPAASASRAGPDPSTAVVDAAAAPSAPSAAVSPAKEPRPPAVSPAPPAPAPGATGTASGARPEDFASLVKGRRFREAFASLGEGGFPREVAAADARRLLELADVARLAGHPREAAQALDRLRLAFRSDSRAGLAALELGRLRMDALGDRKGALAAFDDAVALSRGGAVREDAEARRVHVLEALGEVARCRSLRDAYLSNFPNGVHASAMRRRCTGR